MEAQQKSQSKLTRTNSSLRSSPTIRSSIHSLSSVGEEEEDKSEIKKKQPRRVGSTPRAGSTRLHPALALISLISSGFLLMYFFFFFYLRREEIPTSENLLLALIFIAIALYFASKNKGIIHQILGTIKQSWDESAKRLGFCKNNSKPVIWYIGGDSESTNKIPKEKRVIREGVEFYSNGDCYEGEFHKGRCNGSGVYHYFANGRYEGDWIDGRYDGYGIESWARGSRYKGQYREGLRHGYGVYKFYTGDSYAGEWFNGQSHGVGAQTCSDGSSYVGEFKCGVKHGLGCYHFRNGDRYAGEYFGDLIHGFGVYQFANGHRYEGSWHEGRKQGYGMYTFRNSDAKCGEWDSGSLKTPLPPSTDAVLGAVEAARNASEKAIRGRRVDDQVNRAVMAANRAATSARVAAVKAVQNRIDGKFCDTSV